MKNKDFANLGKKLLPIMPGFASKGPLIFALPIGHVIRGLYFDGSSFNKNSIYINVFFQPLCVPHKYFNFTFSFRLRKLDGFDNWASDDPGLIEMLSESIVVQALPFLARASTLEEVANAAEAMHSKNAHILEAAAYCRMLTYEYAAALSLIDAIGRVADRSVGWLAVLADRANLVRELLTQDPASARRQLLEWEAQTAQNVGLGAFWSR